MAKKFDNGAAPMSKYAAKKANRVKNNSEEFNNDKHSEETVVESNDSNTQNNKEFKKFKRLPNFARNIPEHIINLSLILMNNAEIRRFTGIGICNYLIQKKIIAGKKNFVVFKYDKFAVISDGLSREFSYKESFFIKCLVAAFSSFSASAQITIDEFCKIEMDKQLSEAVTQKDVDDIISLTEEYKISDVK